MDNKTENILRRFIRILLEGDYKGHWHDKANHSDIEWYFHNYEHGYQHCSGGAKNPYELKHIGKKHGINKKYARGHGWGKIPTWFKFTKKINDEWWDLSSGEEIDVSDVPKKFK